MTQNRRAFLTSIGKASVATAAAVAVAPKPAVEVRTVTVDREVIVEKTKTVVSYEHRPRPDLSHLPPATLRGERNSWELLIIATGPLCETHLRSLGAFSLGSGVSWDWRWDHYGHGYFEATIDRMSLECGGRVDEDELFRLCFGDRAYARRLAKRAWRLGAKDAARRLMDKYRLARWPETGEPK